jgi:hypothetical protein
MGVIGNEVSVANQQRRDEGLTQSSVGGVLSSGASITGAVVTLGTSLVVGGPSGLALAGSVVAGMRIVDWFRKLGTTKVEENLEALGQAAEDAFNRVERVLSEQGQSIEEIKKRFESEELKQAMAGASLQALRTTGEKRLKRLALILANGVKENDLEPESLDDMMRAAVELKDADVQLLNKLYDSQSRLLTTHKSLSSDWSQQIALNWSDRFSFLDSPDWKNSRSSLARLQACGLILEVRTMMTPTGRLGTQPFGLLPEGAKFYERLQEIGATK